MTVHVRELAAAEIACASMRAAYARARLCAKFPAEFEHGYRSGFASEFQKPCDAAGYPIGFHTWELVRKNSWYAGWNLGNVEAENG